MLVLISVDTGEDSNLITISTIVVELSAAAAVSTLNCILINITRYTYTCQGEKKRIQYITSFDIGNTATIELVFIILYVHDVRKIFPILLRN